MLGQTTLFENEVVIDSEFGLYQAAQSGAIDNSELLELSKASYMKNQLHTAMLTVMELTSIPAWRNLCTPEQAEVIEQSPKKGLYVKMADGKVMNVSQNMKDLLSRNELDIIFMLWR